MSSEDLEIMEPVSPTGQYLSTSIISLSVIAVLESEVPIDDSQTLPLLNNVFLPINPRFSSIMVTDERGVKRWKKVVVKPENHIKTPKFPPDMSPIFYDEKLDDYISNMAMQQFPENQPLWEIHIIKYPTSNAAGNLIFKLHHSLGDGFTLMGALLSCLQRSDNPFLPLTFPSAKLHVDNKSDRNHIFSNIHKVLSSGVNTVADFFTNFVRSSFVEDDLSPIRSGKIGVEFLPVTLTTMSFPLDVIKQIKSKLGTTINDVISGTIFLGTRLYMQTVSKGSEKANSTSLVLLNTRMVRSYVSVEEMMKPGAELPWGNNFTFLPVSIPRLTDLDTKNPLRFVWIARNIIQKKRGSLALFITAKYLQLIKKLKGPEAVSKYVYGTLKNTSMGITNLIGPTEKMALTNHPVKGLYFVVAGSPQSIMAGVISYMGNLRVAVLAEKGFIDPQKYKACVENAFDMIFKAALNH